MLKVKDFRIFDLVNFFKKNRDVSRKYFESLKDNILRMDGKINAFSEIVKFNPQYIGRGLPVPYSLKDIIDTAGIRTSYGSRMFSNHIPQRDADIVKKMNSRGLLLQGKTSTHEFAMGIVTPQCRNPWNTDRITGGSSGGSAAAVAACFSPFSIGTDTAGSIRIPSALCGVTGLKPTFGLFSLKGIFPEAPSLDTAGPITRFASDLPLILEWMGAINRYNDPLRKPVKAAIIEDLFLLSEKPVKEKIMAFLSRMEQEGVIQFEFITIPELERAAIAEDLIDGAENYSIHKRLFQENSEMYTELSRLQLKSSSEIKAHEYIEANNFRKIWARRISALFRRYDILIIPTSPDIAPYYSDIRDKPPDFFLSLLKFTNPFNLSSSPGISLPCGFLENMPLGLQILGKRMSDFYLCRVASEFQKFSDFHLFAPDDFGKAYQEIVEELFQ